MKLSGWWSGAVVVLVVGSTMCGNSEHGVSPMSQAGAPPDGEGGSSGGMVGEAGSSPSGGTGGARGGMGAIGGSSEAGAGGEGGEVPPPDPPRISPEGSIPNPPTGDGPARYYSNVTLAYGAGVYLTVWSDNSATGVTSDILGARYSEEGALLDARPIVIGAAPGDEEMLTVTFDGTNFLITWSGFRGPERMGDIDVHGARMTLAGRVLDPESIIVLEGTYLHAAAPSTTGWVVAGFRQAPERPPLEIVRVDESGAVTPEREQAFSRYAYDPVLGSGGNSTLALVDLDYTPNGSRLNALLFQDGVSEPLVTEVGRLYGKSHVVWDGAAYYFHWQDNTYARSLERIDPTGARTSLALPPETELAGGIAASATSVVITYNAPENGMTAARARPFATPGLTPGGELVLSTSSEGLSVGVAARGSSSFAVSLGPLLAILDDTASAVVTRTDPVPSIDPSQRTPSVAGDASGFSVAWTEASSVAHTVRLVRFDASGTLVDGAPIEIGSGSNSAVARREGESLVAWTDGGNLRASRIDRQGEIIDTQTLAQTFSVPPFGSYSYGEPSVAATDDGFVVSYNQHPPENGLPNVIARGLYGATTPSPSTPRMTGFNSTSAVAGVDGGYALAFGGLSLELTTGGATRNVAVDEWGGAPSLASAGDRVLVAWELGTVVDAERKIRAAVFEVASGERLGPIVDLTSPGELAHRPSATFDGERFVVAWIQADSETSNAFRAARIETNGRRYDSVAFSLPAPERRRHGPVLAAGAGTVLCAYTRLVEPSAAASVKLFWLND